MPDLRLAIVTGTSSGIGLLVARQLLERGWEVVGISRRPAPIDQAGYAQLEADLRDTPRLLSLLEQRLAPRTREGGFTRFALVNNAADVALLGTVDRIEPVAHLDALAVNVVAPVALMGWLLRTAPTPHPIRLVNVSTAAAVQPFPGLGAYGGTKAALRLTGMVLAAELDLRASAGEDRDVTIWSYEPGVVDTPMQTAVRESSRETVPIVDAFQHFAAAGWLRPAELPARAIVAYIEADGHPRFSEQQTPVGEPSAT